MGRKRGKTVRKNKARTADEDDELASQPHTMVFCRGQVGPPVKRLAIDMRCAFEPNTALRFRFRRRNVLKDVVAIAGRFHVSHLLYLTHTENAVNLRIIRTAHGPTLTFRVLGYSLRSDVLSSLRRFNMAPSQFRTPPLLIMSGFSGEGLHLPLLTTTFRAMFPAVNITAVKLSQVRRVMLMHHDAASGTITWRHYGVRLVPRGLSKAVRRIRRKRLPDLGRYHDLSQFVLRSGQMSDSGLSDGDEDGPHNEVELHTDLGRGGNVAGGRSSVRLTEIGPRLTLQLIKVEEGVNDGEVLFHRWEERSEEERLEMAARHRHRIASRAKRRREQAQRVERKEAMAAAHRQRCLQGMRNKGQLGPEKQASGSEDDDEAEYRREVGVDPVPGLFHKRRKRSIEGLSGSGGGGDTYTSRRQ